MQKRNSPRNTIPVTCPVIINNPIVDNDEVICRICYDSTGRLYQVCNCSGSIKYVHSECLSRWLSTLPNNHYNNTYCELCNEKYKFKNITIEKETIINYLTFFLFVSFIFGIVFFILYLQYQ